MQNVSGLTTSINIIILYCITCKLYITPSFNVDMYSTTYIQMAQKQLLQNYL